MTVGNLGPILSSSKQVAQAVANAKMILAEDGTVAAGIGTGVQVGLFHCLKDGGGFFKDEIYYPVYDTSMVRSSWETLFFDHDHETDGSKNGGNLLRVYMHSTYNAWRHYNGPDPSEWRTSGNGTFDRDTGGDDEDYIRWRTLATAGSTMSAQLSHTSFKFGDYVDMQARFEAKQNTDIFARLGINVDREDEVQSNSRRQMGIECCPASGTKWVIISANGASSTLLQVATTVDISASKGTYQLTLFPGIDVEFLYEGIFKGSTNSANTPFDGNQQRKRSLVCGVKTNIGNVRELQLSWYNLMANPSDLKRAHI
jgi:hypothetical protein